jgi:hypothetical protein
VFGKQWSVGVDNTDANKFKIDKQSSPGLDTVLAIDSITGYMGLGTSDPDARVHMVRDVNAEQRMLDIWNPNAGGSVS